MPEADPSGISGKERRVMDQKEKDKSKVYQTEGFFQKKEQDPHKINVHQQSKVVEKAKQGTTNFLQRTSDAMASTVKNAQEDDYGDAGKLKQKLGRVEESLDAIGSAGRANTIKSKISMESNQYIAADMFFWNQGTELSKARLYYEKNGLTMGVSKAYDKISKNPKPYFIPGTQDFDQDKVLKLIEEKELTVLDADGNKIPKKIENKKFRKKQKKLEGYIGINELEIKMRDNLAWFNAREHILLEKNNRIFNFKHIEDIYTTQSMIDKVIIHDVDDLKKMGFDVESKAIFKGKFDISKMKRMTSKETDRLIDDLEKLVKTGNMEAAEISKIGEIIQGLQSRSLITKSAERIRKLNLRGHSKNFMMAIGGDEMMSTDVGQGIRYTDTALKITQTATSASIHATQLAGKGVHKVASVVAPDATLKYDTYVQKLTSIPTRTTAKIKHTIRQTKYAKKLTDLRNAYVTGKTNLLAKFGKTKVGKATKVAGKAVGITKKVAVTPFKALSAVSDFIKKKIMLPVGIAVGGLFLGFYFLSLILGSGVASSDNMALIHSEEEQFQDYQAKFDSCDQQFQLQVSNIINGFAQTTNLKGNQIHYGINTPGLKTDFITTDPEYRNGVTLNYFYDGTQTAGISSNIEDCLSAMTVLMQQAQSEHHQEALELLEAIYKSTHSYNTQESELYPCSYGCEDVFYYCNQSKGYKQEDGTEIAPYWGSDLRYKPWILGEIVEPIGECDVCKSNPLLTYDQYAGCEVTDTCYHGDDGDMGQSHAGCNNYTAYYECPGHDYTNSQGEDKTRYCSGSIGCEGYYECNGHDHYGCEEGHHVAACFGHIDLTMNVNIASMTKIYDMGGIEVKEGE